VKNGLQNFKLRSPEFAIFQREEGKLKHNATYFASWSYSAQIAGRPILAGAGYQPALS
jgi:hypothetical protein